MSYPLFGEAIEDEPYEVFGEEIEEKPSLGRKVAGVGSQLGKSTVTGALGSYGDILNLVGLSPKANLTPGQEALYRAEFEAPEKDLAALQDEDILPRYSRFPRSEEISERIGENEPQNAAERYAQRIGRAGGGGLALGAGGGTLGALSGAATVGQTAKEMGAPEWAATTLELLSTFGPAGIANKVIKAKDAKRLLEFLRAKGLSETEIAALTQGQTKLKSLSKLAKKSGKAEKMLSSIEEKSGNAYDFIKKEASELPHISGQHSEALADEFGTVITELNQTLKPSPDKQSAINFIQEAYENLINKGAKPIDLMNFYQDINASVKWNAIKGGKKYLARLKKPIMDTLSASSPKLADDFQLANTTYARSKNLIKEMKPNMVDQFLDKGPGGALALGLATGVPGLLFKYIGINGVRSLSRELLFNPRLQNISRKIANAINDNKPKAVNTFVNAFKKEIKTDNPDLYEQLEQASFE